MSDNPKERLDLDDALYTLSSIVSKNLNLMTAINGILGLLRVWTSMFEQLLSILIAEWTIVLI